MKRYMIQFEGRVQGVGFRYFAYTTAKELRLTGSARNLLNGNVEVFVQGADEDLSQFLGRLVKGNGFIRVADYTIKETPVKEDEKDFRILY